MQALLQHIKTVSPLSLPAENELKNISRQTSFKKGQIIQNIGHTCRTIYFVKKGVVRIFYFKGDIDITESFEFENSFVARAESLFTGKPSRKAIQAIEECELIAIDSTKLFTLFNTYHDLETLFRKIIESSYVETVNRIESLQFHTAEERYNAMIKDHPDILKRVPLKYIASYLGITQVSLSRIRAAR